MTGFKNGEGNGNPLQYSFPENPVDRGTWWAAVHGVAHSRTRLKRLSSSSSRIQGGGEDGGKTYLFSNISLSFEDAM